MAAKAEADFLLVVDTAYSVFFPQTEKAKAALPGESLFWRVPTNEFMLPAEIANLEAQGFTVDIEDERGKPENSKKTTSEALQDKPPVVE